MASGFHLTLLGEGGQPRLVEVSFGARGWRGVGIRAGELRGLNVRAWCEVSNLERGGKANLLSQKEGFGVWKKVWV